MTKTKKLKVSSKKLVDPGEGSSRGFQRIMVGAEVPTTTHQNLTATKNGARASFVEPILVLSSPGGGVAAGANLVTGNTTGLTQIQFGFDVGTAGSLTNLGLRMAEFALLFQKWRVRSARLHYRPAAAVTISGQLVLAADLDPGNQYGTTASFGSNPDSIAAVEEMERAMVLQPFQSGTMWIVHPSEAGEFIPFWTNETTSGGNPAPSSAPTSRISNLCSIIAFACTSLPASTPLGTVFLEAELEFQNAVNRPTVALSAGSGVTYLLTTQTNTTTSVPLDVFSNVWSLKEPAAESGPAWWNALTKQIVAAGRYQLGVAVDALAQTNPWVAGTNDPTVNASNGVYIAPTGVNPNKVMSCVTGGNSEYGCSALYATALVALIDAGFDFYVSVSQANSGYPIPGFIQSLNSTYNFALAAYGCVLTLTQTGLSNVQDELEAAAKAASETPTEKESREIDRYLRNYFLKFPRHSCYYILYRDIFFGAQRPVDRRALIEAMDDDMKENSERAFLIFLEGTVDRTMPQILFSEMSAKFDEWVVKYERQITGNGSTAVVIDQVEKEPIRKGSSWNPLSRLT